MRPVLVDSFDRRSFVLEFPSGTLRHPVPHHHPGDDDGGATADDDDDDERW